MAATKSKTILFAIGALVAPIVLYVYWKYDPTGIDAFPSCPIKGLSGYDCPGCGSQRAIHHLLHLEIGKAFEKNALLVVALPYIFAGLIAEQLKGRSKAIEWARLHIFGSHAIWISMVVILLWWVGRNLI